MKSVLKTLKRKWPAYFIEVLVIIIGILAAFALQKWNEERIENNTYHIILESLIIDLENDVSELETLTINCKRLNNAIENIINEKEIPTDSIHSVLLQLGFNPESFTPNTSSFDILENHGAFNLLKLREVSTEVQSLYNSAKKINQESFLDRNKLMSQKIRPLLMSLNATVFKLKSESAFKSTRLKKSLEINEELKNYLRELHVLNELLVTQRLEPLNDKFKDLSIRLREIKQLNNKR